MSTYEWAETTWRERTSTGAVLEAETADAVIRFHLADRDGEIAAAFTVETGGQSYSTDDAEDWTIIERFVPRAEWPEPMYAGKRGPAERTPDRAIVDAIEQFEAGLDCAHADSLDPIEGVRAYLGDVEATDEQVEAIAAAFEHAPAEQPEDYCAGVIEVILGDAVLEDVAWDEVAARAAAARAFDRLRGATVAARLAGMYPSIAELSRVVGRHYTNVRKWWGD